MRSSSQRRICLPALSLIVNTNFSAAGNAAVTLYVIQATTDGFGVEKLPEIGNTPAAPEGVKPPGAKC